MSVGIFTDKKTQPAEEDIRAAVGDRWRDWCELIQHIRDNYQADEDLKFLYGKNYGWALRFRAKNQVLAALFPTGGGFTVQVNLSEAGCERARRLVDGLEVGRAIDAANPYPEGRWLFIKMVTDQDLADIRQVIAIRAEEKRISRQKAESK